MKKYDSYYDRMHRLGKWVTVASMLIFFSIPLIISLRYGMIPKFGDLILAAGGLCAIFIPTSIAETMGEVPVMGSSYYVANITGNILNLKLPAALNAVKIAKVKTGTEAADAITGIAIVASSMVTLVMIFIGVLLMAPLKPFFDLPVVSTAANYVLPALFGCLILSMFSNDVGGGVIIKKRLHAAVIPFIACIIIYLLIPDLYGIAQGFVMILCIPAVYLITKHMYKKGKITVELPEEKMEEMGNEVSN